MTKYSKKGLRVKSLSLFFYFIFCSSFSWASADLLSQANNLKLAENPHWIKILHYEKKWLTFSQHISAIQNEEFFLSKVGRKDPAAELSATLDSFTNELSGSDINSHSICRFPARYKWLKKKLSWIGRDDILKQCKKYSKWSRDGKIKSISLFFATGYFGNPASYFGHALIKFNTDQKNESLLDTSVNYGALTDGNENPIVYIFKGLFGGFDASYTNQIFYQHNHNYSETELRDLWEYRLNLTPEEVEFIVDHTWELLSQKFSYKFLSDNCAYRIAELLEIVYDTQLIPHNPLYTMPVTLFEGLGTKTRSNGQPVVTQIKRAPSRQSRMSEKYLNLNENQKLIVKNIANESEHLKGNDFKLLPSNEKISILETLIDYYSFKIISEPNNPVNIKKRQEVLLERLSLPTKNTDENNALRNYPAPHLSQNSFMLRIGYVENNEQGKMTELNIRPALYDLLSPTASKPVNTGLEITNLKIRIKSSHIDLSELSIFKVHNFNTPRTDLPGEKKLSWKINLGIHPQRLNCEECNVLGAHGGIGTTSEVNSKTSFYALLSGVGQSELNQYGTLAVLPEIGLLADIFQDWKLHLNVGYRKFMNGQKNETTIFQFENRFGYDRNWDIRLSYKKIETSEVTLSVAGYF